VANEQKKAARGALDAIDGDFIRAAAVNIHERTEQFSNSSTS
jgi:hypothetical protein